MKKSKRTWSVFYKYLISFFLVALLPIGVGTASFYQYNINSLKKQTETINRQRLRQSVQLLDEVVFNHFKMASAIMTEPSLQQSRLLGESYDQYESLTILKPYLNRNPDWEKGYLIMKGTDSVYSSTGMMSFSTLSRMVLGFDDAQEQTVRETLEQAEGYCALGTKETGEYLLFIHPIPGFRAYANLVFVMDIAAIREGFREEGNGEGEQLIILKGNSEILLSDFSEEENREYTELLALSAGQESGLVELEGAGREKGREILYFYSRSTDITYGISFSAENAMVKELQHQKNIMVLFCFLILILCMGLALCVAGFTYKPIRELLRLLDAPAMRRNEMTALHEYIENQKELTHSVHWQTPYVQQRIMELYLEGLIDGEELEKAFGEFTFAQGDNGYFAIIIGIKAEAGAGSSSCRQELLNLSLEMELRYDVHICHMEKIKEAYIVWIVNVKKKEKAQNLVMGLQQETNSLSFNGAQPSLIMGVGSCVESLMDIRSSYYEALAAEEYIEAHPKGRLLFYEKLPEVLGQEELQDGECLLKLVQALRKGDRELSLELYGQYTRGLHQKYHSQILYRYFSFKMFKLLKDSLVEYIPENLIEELMRAAAEETDAARDAGMQKFLNHACDWRTLTQKSSQLELTNKILDYIKKNVFLPTLSLEQMGDEFGLSTYYISRFMTEQTGTNLKSYITELRMEEARRLLRETNLPLYEIVVQIGYLDVSSFIRKFKKEMGKTPGEYREEWIQGCNSRREGNG